MQRRPCGSRQGQILHRQRQFPTSPRRWRAAWSNARRPQRFYLDPAGYRTWDSGAGTRDVYGQKRLVIVSQRFHLRPRPVSCPRGGMEAWGFEARDVETAYSIFTELRRYPSALRAYLDAWTAAAAPRGSQTPVKSASIRQPRCGTGLVREFELYRRVRWVALSAAAAFVALLVTLSAAAVTANQVMTKLGQGLCHR